MYMVKTEDLNSGDFRRLETDSVIVSPVKETIRLVLTSDDVIHSFALPSLGLKMDAVPGRLNQQFFSSQVVGVFYGQCSEICGANHSFMPIVLEVYKDSFPGFSFNSWFNQIFDFLSINKILV